jgi:hypothetical protein
MPSSEPGAYRVGETALVAEIPEAEPLVGRWRSRLVSFAADGVPAHVTILYPFLDRERLDRTTLSRLATLIGSHAAFDVRFLECGRFPGVLYLAPFPDQPFRALTEAIAGQWPESQPYGGRFAEIVPHLTVAHQQEARLLDQVEADLTGGLPLSARVHEIHLLVSDGHRWRREMGFELLRHPR